MEIYTHKCVVSTITARSLAAAFLGPQTSALAAGGAAYVDTAECLDSLVHFPEPVSREGPNA